MRIFRLSAAEDREELKLCSYKNATETVNASYEIEKKIKGIVEEIIANVQLNKDKEVAECTLKFDGFDFGDSPPYKFEVSENVIKDAYESILKDEIDLLELAAKRIKDFHERQIQKSWEYTEEDGTVLGQKITPIERVGIYVPGGKAAYPSTVLMNAIPARVAGVKEIIMVTPPGKDGIVNKYVLAAAKIAKVDRVFRVGGAQAIAALAYGTESIPQVDKITGPGNAYVAMAKKLVYGEVDIDMIAGPSEILIINDGTGDPAWIAADLLSQAEHDEMARCILITTSYEMAEVVNKEVEKQIEGLNKKHIAKKSIDDVRSYILIADNLKDAANVSNGIAPEHLELFVRNPRKLLKRIKNAGAIFLGRNTPEAVGDYIAGPNHTLPTGGTARFSSPLGVEDFIKRSSVIKFSKKGLKTLGSKASAFALLEGLDAHAKSVEMRLKKE